MRTTKDGASPPATFTRSARRTQLVACAIDAIVDLGYQQASVAEVARRAGVSKGVVTYHFTAKDDLIAEVVAEVFASVGQIVGPRLEGVSPDQFVGVYIESWVDYYRTHRRYMLAVAEIRTKFRNESGRPHLDVGTIVPELSAVEQVLGRGQVSGDLRTFSTHVMAVTLKAALDGLLGQLANDPGLDLDAYALELVTLFDRATRFEPGP